MTVMSIAPPSAPEQVSSAVLVALVAAGPQRLPSLLDPWLPSRPARIVVVDAAASEAPALPGVEIEGIVGALGADDAADAAELIRHSLPGLFSLRPATDELREVFPGLREVSRRGIPCLPFTELTDRLGGTANPVTLILDFPGEELALLSGLERHGLLGRIERLRLRCGAERFFDGALTADQLEAWLAERGFSRTARDGADSAWPVLDFAADPLRRRLAALERTLADRDAALEEARTEAAETARRLQETAAQRDTARTTAEAAQKALADRDAALDKARAEAAETANRLQEISAQRDTARTTAEAAQKALADRDAALEEARTEAADTARRLQEMSTQLHTVHAAAEAAQKTLADRDAALDKTRAEAAETTRRLQAVTEDARRRRLALRDSEEATRRAQAALDGMRADHGRLLAMLQAQVDDAAALRDSHRRLWDEKQALEDLIGKLAPRLQDAAAQLRTMALLPGEVTSAPGPDSKAGGRTEEGGEP